MSASILILNGSPRRKGNTAFLVGKLVEGIREGAPDAVVEIINLNSLQIKPCQVCEDCRREGREGRYCVVNDDMAPLYDKIVEAGCIVFASPVYWFSVTAQTKLFMDRMYGLWTERTHVLDGKTIAALMVYGDADPYISGAVNAFGMFESYCRYTNSRLAGIVYGSAMDLGDAETNAELCEKAIALGKKLAQPAGC